MDEEVQFVYKLIYKQFLQVIVSSDENLIIEPKFIVGSMEQICIKKGDKGSIIGEQKVKSLN